MTLAARQRKKKRRAVAGQAYEKPTRTARLAARRLEAGERSARVRHARAEVALRSLGRCEWCHDRPAGELHHLVGGVGKRRTAERVDTMVFLCVPCHQGYHAGNVAVMEDGLTWAIWNGFNDSLTEIHRRLHKAKRALPRGRT